MKIAFLLLVFCINSTCAGEYCFLAKEKGKVLKSEGNTHARYAPESTFKIALSLIGFDAGILIDEDHPSWSCKEEYEYCINVWRGDHVPRTWIRDSCLWYSQVLTTKLGMEKLNAYVEQFNYGNMDLTGDKGQYNGLTHAWVSSSLQISPDEQTQFLQKIVDEQLPISESSYYQTKKIMFVQELTGGWKLYGKSGSGRQPDHNNNNGLQHGWFVGYIEKNQTTIVFASHIIDREKQNSFASFRARNEALIKLWYLIDELENE